MSTQSPNQSARQRRMILAALGGAGLLAVCACFAIAVAAGVYYFWGRGEAEAQAAVEYILDASPRMLNPASGGTRLSVAQAILAEIVRPADTTLTAGLRVFGTGAVAQPCQDTNLIVPLAQANQSQIADNLFTVSAGSAADAALAEAMVNAIRDLAGTPGSPTLVVVTGGADSCNEQAGELIKAEAQRAGIQLQMFVVGFMVEETETEAVKGLIDESADGVYVDAPDTETLRNVLTQVQKRIESPATTSVADVRAAATPAVAVTAPPIEATADTGISYQSQTACDHPYFPLRQGATWTYAGDGFQYTWVVNSVIGDLNNATADVSFVMENAAMNYTWTCTSEGVTYFQGGSIVSEGFTVANFTVTGQSGSSLLAPGGLVPGATWDTAYTMQYTLQAEGFSSDVSMSASESHTAGERQSLTNSVGSFDVIPVLTNASYTTTMSFGDASTTTSSGVYTTYYGYGVGIVRSESNFNGVTGKTELVSYSIP